MPVALILRHMRYIGLCMCTTIATIGLRVRELASWQWSMLPARAWSQTSIYFYY